MLHRTAIPVAADVELLGPNDPPPFEIVNPEGAAPVLLLCDHASRHLPEAYGTLGLVETELHRHIAWDIGAGDVTRRLAALLDAPAVLCGYSRLLIDCNRALDDPTSIVMISDGTVVPGNRDLSELERARRAAAVHTPYHQAVAGERTRFAARGVVPAIISIHSFTPVFGGFERPWHVGILWDTDPRLARPLLEILGADPAIEVGDNQPYTGRLNYGYSIDTHGARLGLPHVLIELRQDLVDTHHGAEAWSARLHEVLVEIMSDQSIYRVQEAQQ